MPSDDQSGGGEGQTTLTVEFTAEGGAYYRVFVDGEQVSRHTLEYRAVSTASRRKLENPGAEVWYENPDARIVAKTSVVIFATPQSTASLVGLSGQGLAGSLGVATDAIVSVGGVVGAGTPGSMAVTTEFDVSVQMVGAQGLGAAGSVTVASEIAGEIQIIRQTPEQIALYMVPDPSIASDAYAICEYKQSTSSTWLTAHPLYRIRPGTTDDAFAGIIFDLEPGTLYDLRVTLHSGATSEVVTTSTSTRALPAVAGTPTATPSTFSAIQSALDAASPGDVIEIQDGDYSIGTTPLSLTQSGTASNPIYLRGQSRNATRLLGTAGNRLIDVQADNVVIENMTMEGNNPARSIATSAMAIRVATTATSQSGLTVRDCLFSNVVRGVQSAGGSSGGTAHNCLVYNNEILGTMDWSNDTITNLGGTGSLWQNDGVRLVGYGNCVWGNTIDGFSDSVTFAHSVDQASGTLECNYCYRNYMRNSIDNVVELDHSERLHGVYDNYCENINTGVSQSDNGSVRNYGPTYVFRNLFVNVAKRPIKPNDAWQGWHHYNNTYVRTRGEPGDFAEQEGLVANSPSGADNDRWLWRNNVFICRHAIVGELLNFRIAPSGVQCEPSHNAWFPDGEQIRWQGNGGVTYPSGITQAIAATDTHATVYPSAAGLSTSSRWHEHDVLSESNPFGNTLTLGATAVTELTDKTTLEIASSSALKNAGVALPGITDGYTGAAPDMGAVIEGRDPVIYGHTTAPTYFLEAPRRQWIQIPQINTAASVGMTNGMFDNFTGMGIDQVRGSGVKAAAGGHTIDWLNGTYEVVFKTERPFWRRLIDDTLIQNRNESAPGNSGDASYNDGTPRGVHNWNAGCWAIGDKIILPCMTGQYPSGAFGSQVWSVDRQTITNPPQTALNSQWTFHGRGAETVVNLEAALAAYDYDTGLIWCTSQYVHTGTGAYPFWTIDPETMTITQYPSFGGAFPAGGTRLLRGSGFIVEGYFFMLAPRSQDQTALVMDLSNPTASGTVQYNSTGSPNWSNLDGAGVFYVPAERRAYFYKSGMGRTLITLEVPANPATGTYVWGTETPSVGLTPSGIDTTDFSHFNGILDMGNGETALVWVPDQLNAPYMFRL